MEVARAHPIQEGSCYSAPPTPIKQQCGPRSARAFGFLRETRKLDFLCEISHNILQNSNELLGKPNIFWLTNVYNPHVGHMEKTLESPFDCKGIKSVNPKGNQPWIFTGRTDAKALATWCEQLTHWKRPDAGKDWGQEEKGTTEDEMVGWHLWLNGHEFEQAPGVGEGQGSLVCFRPWGHKELDTTEGLNWTEKENTSYIPDLKGIMSKSCIDGFSYLDLWLTWN